MKKFCWYRYNKTIFFIVFTLWMIIGFTIGCASVPTPKDNLSSGSFLQQGTKVEDLDLSGVHYNDSEKLIDQWQQNKLAQHIILDCNKAEISVSLEELGAEIDQAKILADIKNNPGQTIEAIVHLHNVKANLVLRDKLVQFEGPAIDATYKIENNKFLVTDSIPAKIPVLDNIISQIDNQTLNHIRYGHLVWHPF